MSPTFEDALEVVLSHLDNPPAEGTPEDEAFLAALGEVLVASQGGLDNDDGARQAIVIDDDLRTRLEAIAHRRRLNPFGEHPDGIGPTLGMDLRVKPPG
ncbi:hypothetical protein V7S57_10975 [Caulobacter sp. CCNWLY153]|uniref:Uncharacterized protein n=1 Tax=Caulobacter radicis TaxID=2172650 RepID=A0A2T9JMB6_9CAUL|nr:hypothetical protein [Caulobacter radicis]PVM84830.1 hypothetical protein DDF65_08325 [Caulobacter radicis]PVM87666.1 hypothetical protein DDF62_16240 [Caulobacter radicis]